MGVASVVVMAAMLYGCSSSSSTPDAITLYNGQHVQTTDALAAAFTKETGIKVNIRSDDEDVFAAQIVDEGSHTPADVLMTENSPPLQYLASKDLLAPVDPSTLANTPSTFNSPDGKWVGVTARVSVLDYNTNLLKPSDLPTSAMDLADPKWKGKLGIAPGETDFQPIITSIARTYGEPAALKWLEAVKENAGSHLYPDNETLTDEINKGQVSIGIINQYYWYREQVEKGASNMHSAITYFAPGDVGYVIDIAGAAVLSASHNKPDAQKFLAFITSKQGQEIIAHSDSFEYPVASGVTTAKPETPFTSLQPNPITVSELGDGALAEKLLHEAQLQ